MSYEYRGFYIPDRMMSGLERYIKHGIEPGGFLFSILSGKSLMEVVNRADDENLANLPAYAGYLYNEVPTAAWGSTENVAAWMAKKQAEAGDHE